MVGAILKGGGLGEGRARLVAGGGVEGVISAFIELLDYGVGGVFIYVLSYS